MATYGCLYFLDSEKTKFYFILSRFIVEKIPGNSRFKTLHKKIRKMTIFNANFRLVYSYCPEVILTYNIWTFICKKISKSWPLLVLVSQKYCAEERLLKTHVAFLMKVTVDWSFLPQANRYYFLVGGKG